MSDYRRMATLRSMDELRGHARRLGVSLPLSEVRVDPNGPLAQPRSLADGFTLGNRFCIQPMEGWDGTERGLPSELTRRRWIRFGRSGAKLIWGGEAVAVRPDGRANPNQLLIDEENVGALAELREALVEAHEAAFGRSDDLLVGLQLTHSGRFSRPRAGGRPEPVIGYHHPVLDRRFGIPADHPVLTDAEIEQLAVQFADAAELAAGAGFQFVDVKHCHGYLGHELLSAHARPGPFGGSFENRTRFLRTTLDGIRARVPRLRVGVRLSAFDTVPYRSGAGGVGEPEEAPTPYEAAFGADPHEPTRPLLDEPVRLLELLESLGVSLVNVTAGSPYYSPHVQRPALFPPSDGYGPPEDPLIGVARQIETTAVLKRRFPRLILVGSAYSYLQEWLPLVAQGVLREGGADFVGLGRLALSYPELPADVLAGRPLDRLHLCRTFSDCTTAPRNGLASGCYPLDAFYRSRSEAVVLREIKRRAGVAGDAGSDA
jgi:2,4-dienoyl-CoA reductase-like NADH-dependent reductase (Old Yellow Enzyme family)